MKKVEKKQKGSNLVIILFAVIAFLIAIGVLLFIKFNKKDNIDDTYKIAQRLSNQIKGNGKVTLVETGEDQSYSYSYLNTVAIYNDDTDSKEFTVAIAKYHSNEEALKKVEYINGYNAYAHSKFDNTVVELSEVPEQFYMNNLLVVKGIYLISINSNVQDKEKVIASAEKIIDDYKNSDLGKVDSKELNDYWAQVLKDSKYFVDATYKNTVDKTKQTILELVDEMAKCTGDKCEELLVELKDYVGYKEVKEEVNKVKAKYAEVTKKKAKVVKTVNKEIKAVKKSLNEKKYNELKKKIANLTDMYYDSYKPIWEAQLNAIKPKVEAKAKKAAVKNYKKACKKYKYKKLLRNPEKYDGKKAYFFGKVLQVVDDGEYRVGVNCHKYHYFKGYYCDNTIYMTYDGSKRLIEDDMIKIWGTMNGTKTYTSVLGASITIPEMNAKYITRK